ncbi:MAG: GGDEF domain-containing response regulator [Spirochaetes bacterium]|nr:GGDEF domain-containing response regulator [Spirochaetota bacterium]
MMKHNLQILLIEDNPDDIHYMLELFSILNNEALNEYQFKVITKGTISDSLDYLVENHVDVILLDLALPDNRGIECLEKFEEIIFEIPIIVLTGLNDQALAKKMVRSGVEDFLIKDTISKELLLRTIRFSIERHKMLFMLKQLAVMDDLTGLYNRRGFYTLAHHHCKLAKRREANVLIFYIDIDKMKQINDNHGHKEGDIAIVDTANILKESFRDTDIIARIGGDEFVVLAIEAHANHRNMLLTRLEDTLLQYQKNNNRLFQLSLSYGVEHYINVTHTQIDEILENADNKMYEHKRKKKMAEERKP